MDYVIVKDNKIIWRGKLIHACMRLAPALGGTACLEVDKNFIPITEFRNTLPVRQYL